MIAIASVAAAFRGLTRLLIPVWLMACGSSQGATAPPTRNAVDPVPPLYARQATLVEIDHLVRTRFYSPALLEVAHWTAHVEQVMAGLHAPGADQRSAFDGLLRTLQTSHTEYIPRSAPSYWELASIFEDVFAEVPTQCPNMKQRFPPMPVQWDSIGVAWRNSEGSWFVGGVYDDSPGRKSSLQLGDEVLQADGQPFDPVRSFAGKAEQAVQLSVRRRREAAPEHLVVTPVRVQPMSALQAALRASARIINQPPARIAYVHVWAWTGDDMQQELKDAISRLNRDQPTGFVLDLRDGWGGASPDYLSIFQKEVPVMTSSDLAGHVNVVDSQIRVPAVVLINKGSRSGKEVIAYAVKKWKLATLLGENTAGAMLAGSPFCLPDGSLLYVATFKIEVDGELLEGRGVAPDIAVPFDVRYAAGEDLQLQAAVSLLAKQSVLSSNTPPRRLERLAVQSVR